MHCRLKLDAWIEDLTKLQTLKQSLYTRLQLMRQAQELGVDYDEEDPFWQSEEFAGFDDDAFEDDAFDDDVIDAGPQDDALILPTDTPRDKASEKRLYRQLVRKFHPDLGLTAVEIAYRTDMMTAVNIAHEQQDVQALYDLAGELDPIEVAEIASIRSSEIRDLRRQLLESRRRRRRARRRLESLRSENTSRLWRKARHLDESGTDWWEVVRREIELAIERIQEDVNSLQESINQMEDHN
jgi:Mg2+ and Co2+ transporter CorA